MDVKVSGAAVLVKIHLRRSKWNRSPSDVVKFILFGISFTLTSSFGGHLNLILRAEKKTVASATGWLWRNNTCDSRINFINQRLDKPFTMGTWKMMECKCTFVLEFNMISVPLEYGVLYDSENELVHPSVRGLLKPRGDIHAVEYLHRMYDKKIFCDGELEVDDGVIEFHKSIVGASSPILRDILELNIGKRVNVSCVGYSAEVWSAFFQFIYGEVNDSLWQVREDLLKFGDAHEIPELVETCTEAYGVDLHSSNVVDRMDFAHCNNLEKLKEKCKQLLFEFKMIMEYDEATRIEMLDRWELSHQLLN